MKTIPKRLRVDRAAPRTATAVGRKALVAKFACEFMVKPGQPTFDAIGELLRARGHSR
jgi:hypothetical protein